MKHVIPRRLDKYLRDSTSMSLVEIRDACSAGRVALTSAGWFCNACASDALVFEGDVVLFDGQSIVPRDRHRYLILNKPRYVTSTTKDPTHRTDLSPWLRQMPPGVFAVGRLDRESSGALLFTDDGDFSNAILQPGHHTSKLYWLWLDEHLADDDPRLRALIDGDYLNNGHDVLRTVSASIHDRTLHTTELHVILDEGKNRHIRKICNLLGLRLLQLHRKAIGSLHIDALQVGQWRELTPQEVEQLWQSCGGTIRIRQTKIAALIQLARASAESGQSNNRLEAWLNEATPSVP